MESAPIRDRAHRARGDGLHFRAGDMPPLFGDTAAALIVDDDPQVAASLARLLGREGYRCSCAPDAAEARILLAERPFALALIDVFMPGESGLELTDSMISEHPDLAVVIVTAIDQRSIAELALESGAYGYVVKPFRPNELLCTVANAGRRRCLEIIHRAYHHRLERLVEEQAVDLAVAQDLLNQVGAGPRPSRSWAA
jgi:DNA-binding response OmpR family regulator